jgi:hypothetical protein
MFPLKNNNNVSPNEGAPKTFYPNDISPKSFFPLTKISP